MNTVRIAELCCGIGAFTLAGRQAGYCPVFAADIDPVGVVERVRFVDQAAATRIHRRTRSRAAC